MTSTSTWEARLRELFGADRIHRQAPLAPWTTFKVGGPAEYLLLAGSSDELRRAIAVAADAGLPLTVLGGGSNVLVADAGVPGLVVRVHGGRIVPVSGGCIRADAGVTINGLVRWTVAHGYAGLEAWAGTPGTVGGAMYGNAHFRGRNIGDLVDRAVLATRRGTISEVLGRDLAFAYDYSRLQRTGEVVLSVDFHVTPGRPDELRAVARESLGYRKRTQPLALPSAGCIFQNPNPAADRVPDGVPCSAGALIDRSGLKGAREGAARVSPTHANFIVNEGGATAADIRRLIDRCRDAVQTQSNVTLREEIVYLGFEDSVVRGGAEG
jgi:UDP-N-acetylmuramate dehydrogenase